MAWRAVATMNLANLATVSSFDGLMGRFYGSEQFLG